MAAEFNAAFDQMAREMEMEELRQEIEALKTANPLNKAAREIEESVEPIAEDVRDLSNPMDESKKDAPAAPPTGTEPSSR